MSSSLLRTEWLKIKKYPAFWWLTAIVALSYPGMNYILYSQAYLRQLNNPTMGPILKMLGNPFTFPEIWHTVAYISSWFVFIPSVLVIMFISNEYTYKTHRQNVIDGWSRKQFMVSKMIDVLFISLLATTLFFLTALVIGLTNKNDMGSGSMWGETKYIALFFIQTFSQLSLAFVIAFLARRAFVALGIFLFYFVILEPVIVGIARDRWNDIGRFMPLEISDRIIPLPRFLIRNEDQWKDLMNAINVHLVYTVILIALTWGFCFWRNSKRDL
jgi:ABC-2 type transport system permease protein